DDAEATRPSPLAIRACAWLNSGPEDLWLSATGAVVNGGGRPPVRKSIRAGFVPARFRAFRSRTNAAGGISVTLAPGSFLKTRVHRARRQFHSIDRRARSSHRHGRVAARHPDGPGGAAHRGLADAARKPRLRGEGPRRSLDCRRGRSH